MKTLKTFNQFLSESNSSVGVAVPLDLPMLEEVEKDINQLKNLSNRKERYNYIKNFSKEKLIDIADELYLDYEEYDDIEDKVLNSFDESLKESKMPTQDQVDKFFALTQNEIHYLNSKPVAGQEKTFNKMEVEPWDEYDLSNWNSLVRKAKSKGQLKENEDLKVGSKISFTFGSGSTAEAEVVSIGTKVKIKIHYVTTKGKRERIYDPKIEVMSKSDLASITVINESDDFLAR